MGRILRPNTTYSIQFGEAIVDITVVVAAKNIKRVFSTGTFIDSCSISGIAFDFFDGNSRKKRHHFTVRHEY